MPALSCPRRRVEHRHCAAAAKLSQPICRRQAATTKLPPSPCYCQAAAAVALSAATTLPPSCRRVAAELPPSCRRTTALLPPPSCHRHYAEHHHYAATTSAPPPSCCRQAADVILLSRIHNIKLYLPNIIFLQKHF